MYSYGVSIMPMSCTPLDNVIGEPSLIVCQTLRLSDIVWWKSDDWPDVRLTTLRLCFIGMVQDTALIFWFARQISIRNTHNIKFWEGGYFFVRFGMEWPNCQNNCLSIWYLLSCFPPDNILLRINVVLMGQHWTKYKIKTIPSIL